MPISLHEIFYKLKLPYFFHSSIILSQISLKISDNISYLLSHQKFQIPHFSFYLTLTFQSPLYQKYFPISSRYNCSNFTSFHFQSPLYEINTHYFAVIWTITVHNIKQSLFHLYSSIESSHFQSPFHQKSPQCTSFPQFHIPLSSPLHLQKNSISRSPPPSSRRKFSDSDDYGRRLEPSPLFPPRIRDRLCSAKLRITLDLIYSPNGHGSRIHFVSWRSLRRRRRREGGEEGRFHGGASSYWR